MGFNSFGIGMLIIQNIITLLVPNYLFSFDNRLRELEVQSKREG